MTEIYKVHNQRCVRVHLAIYIIHFLLCSTVLCICKLFVLSRYLCIHNCYENIEYMLSPPQKKNSIRHLSYNTTKGFHR